MMFLEVIKDRFGLEEFGQFLEDKELVRMGQTN